MRIVIANRSATIAQAFALLMQQDTSIEIASTVTVADEILSAVTVSCPDLVLVDPQMPKLDLASLIGQMSKVAPKAGVAVLSDSEDPAHIRLAVESGARAYIDLSALPEELIRTIHLVGEGHVVASGPGVEHLYDIAHVAIPEQVQSPDGLSDREVEVIYLIAHGKSNREIAHSLIVTENTVKVHLRNIYQKLHVSNRQQLAIYALQSHLVRAVQVESVEV